MFEGWLLAKNIKALHWRRAESPRSQPQTLMMDSADIALKIHCRLLRILYRIQKGETPMELPTELVCFANGRDWKYNPSSLHLDETAMLLYKYNTRNSLEYSDEIKEKFVKYIRRLVNPACPLNNSISTMEVLGAYNQPQLHITEKLVVRVGDNSEAYLSTASPPNRPTSGLIGQIQANTSYTKEFIFDRDIVTCDFFETQLRCKQRPDALISLYSTKDHALPLTRDLHLMTIDKGKLVSKILSTAPVRVQMHFADYKVSLRVVDVCPRISDNEITTKGCYACNMLSELRIMAHSSCHPGTVSVEFQILSIFTRTLVLETEPREFVIKFNAEHKCFDEKICLKSRNMKHCKLISFCLDEPSIHLLNLNTTYTRSFVHENTSGSSFFGFISLPTLSNIFFSLKFIGTFLVIICLSITLCSTCMTCCKR